MNTNVNLNLELQVELYYRKQPTQSPNPHTNFSTKMLILENMS